MSSSNFTTILLNLKDENIKIFEDKVSVEAINGVDSLIISGVLSYKPTHCPKCRHANEGKIKVHGYKESLIKLPSVSRMDTYLKLNKQRCVCTHCGKTFTLKSNIVEYGCFISNNTKMAITLDCRERKSEKTIAKENNVSQNTVSRVIFSEHTKTKVDYSSLPHTICFDEFKSTKDADGAMSFIYMDYSSGKIIDILESRVKDKLVKHFERYTKEARNMVKRIVIDMYAPYISLIKSVFPKAKIVFDRFHIVNLVSRSLNKTRIATMNNHKDYYNKFKRYYKLLLKRRSDLDCVNFKRYKCFHEFMSELDIVDFLLTIDEEFTESYKFYQLILSAIKNRDSSQFSFLIHNHWSKLSQAMLTSKATYVKYEEYIINALETNASNGPLEATNNTIKAIKRVAFGFRSFFNFRNRILIIHNFNHTNKERVV